MTPGELSTTTIERLGRYQVLRSIGRGGMAEVFLARSVGPGGIEKLVCIKRILPALAMDPRAARRFVSEARVTLSLQHANIVPVFEFERHDQELFLVMEWIDGCDLGRLLAEARAQPLPPMPPILAAYVASEVAKALAYAHGRRGGDTAGLIHRDVTPRNVLLSRSGEVRLTDFGLARALGAAGAAGGTPRYMAPEQARGEPPRPADDLYALGLLLAEILLGRSLRVENTIADAARTDVVVPTGELERAHAPLGALVERLLARAPADRPARATDVQAALAQILASATLAGEDDPRDTLSARVRAIAPAPDGEGAVGSARSGQTAAAVTAGTMTEPKTAPPRRGRPARLLLMTFAVAGAGAVVVAGVTRRARRETAPVAASASGPTSGAVATPGDRAATGVPLPLPVPAPPAARALPVAAVSVPAPADTEGPGHGRAAVARARRASASLRILAPGSWVTVYLDGRKLSDDAGTFPIPVGRHRLVVENGPLRFHESEIVTAREGETIERTYRP